MLHFKFPMEVKTNKVYLLEILGCGYQDPAFYTLTLILFLPCFYCWVPAGFNEMMILLIKVPSAVAPFVAHFVAPLIKFLNVTVDFPKSRYAGKLRHRYLVME